MKTILLILSVFPFLGLHAQTDMLTIEYNESRNCYLLLSDREVDSIEFTKYNRKKKVNETVKKVLLRSKIYKIPKKLVDKSDRLTIVIETFFVLVDLKNSYLTKS